MFFAGGGAKPGVTVGATDEVGWRAVENDYRMRDVHVTTMHLMGLNDMRLTHYDAGRNMRLTDAAASRCPRFEESTDGEQGSCAIPDGRFAASAVHLRA